MMDELDFSKILQEAEALSSEIDASTDMPRVQRNLRQVLEAGQLLVSRNARDEPGALAETKAYVYTNLFITSYSSGSVFDKGL